MDQPNYPLPPQHIDTSVTRTDSAYRRQVMSVFMAIVVFFIVYFLLIVAALLLFATCVILAYFVLSSVHMFVVLMLALGLVGCGSHGVFFLIKFIFAVKKFNTAASIEVEPSMPLLFDFIRRLTAETETAFPKKIFISPDVNAGVFYDSSFLSMLFPVKKNLQSDWALSTSLR